MSRIGKIARLPQNIRDQINEKLHEGVHGVTILLWLNDLPVVRAIMAECFGGQAIGPQNLTNWNQGGYLDWLAQKEIELHTRDFLATKPIDGTFASHMATTIMARYAALLSRVPLEGPPPADIWRQMDALHRLNKQVMHQRREELHEREVKCKESKEERDWALAEPNIPPDPPIRDPKYKKKSKATKTKDGKSKSVKKSKDNEPETEEEEDEFFTEEFYPETFAAMAAEEKDRKKKGLKPDPDDEGEPI